MKSKLLLLLAAPLLLVGCKSGGSSEAPATSSSDSSGSDTSSEPQGQSFSFASVIALYEQEGVEGVSIPNYEAASSEAACTYDSANGEFHITGSSNAEMQTYAAALTAAGWTLEADTYGDYSGQFGETRATVELEDWIDYSKACIVLYFGLAPENVFPSEEIATYVDGKGWSDSVPAFANALTTGFQFNADYDQLIILTAAGSEDTLLSAVISFYTGEEGGFIDGGEDANGYHLISPNHQFEMVAWDYTSQYPGYVIINFQEYVAPAASFPVSDVNTFLTTYGLGFQLSAEATYSGTAFSSSSGEDSDGYHYLMITATGGEFASYVSLLEPLVTGAGFSKHSASTDVKYIYTNSAQSQVSIISNTGSVTILFYE